ncbi:uncharacterized protein PV07_12637 [Cladophialophora immunda]|uniref:Indoleamine 2,3-dioxygenase n=1 Tax=Cladophialophora immunda TaxID=569365 RepID=A0A0D1Z2X6_9EURO|nr:uncharacterized protein PV07_12637 [Cladophialophora immunda]KIW21961.1 hypothetical protein PV07_12637 [Cladophialophora immunda]
MTANIIDLGALSRYDISLETAFVPEVATATSLPPPFAPIEGLLSHPPLPEAISSGELRDKVRELPLYRPGDCSRLSLAEKRRMLVILTFVAHGYIWGNGVLPVIDRLPESISVLLDRLSAELGTAPLGTYASTVLWNSRRKDEAKGWTLDNVSIDLTFTDTTDENWFYNVSVCVEAAGGKALSSLLQVLFEIREDSPRRVHIQECFLEAQNSLGKMLVILKEVARMNNATFYQKIRPYFGGWSLVNNRGVHYDGVDEPSTYRTYVGISAAQSSLFQAFDIILGISHGEFVAAYLRNIRTHMPSSHREFLGHLETDFGGTLSSFIDHQPDLADGYHRCRRILRDFRATHKSFAKRYAVEPASFPGRSFGLARLRSDGGGVEGAGGTRLLEFLEEIQHDTMKVSSPSLPSSPVSSRGPGIS